MLMLIRLSDGTLVNENDFRQSLDSKILPATLTPEVLGAEGAALVTATPKPDVEINQLAIDEGELELVNNQWVTKWTIHTLAGAEAEQILYEEQTNKWLAIKRERDHRLTEVGVPVTVDGVTKGFETDVLNRGRYDKLDKDADRIMNTGGNDSMIVQANNTDVIWKTMDNSPQPMTIKWVRAVVKAVSDQEAVVFAHAELLRAQMESLDDPRAFDVTAGWPSLYAVQGVI